MKDSEKLGTEIGLTIDGKRISCLSGITILNAAMENGIKIPTLCHHPQLEPIGACRLCLVEEENSGRIFASCVTPVSSDMILLTDTPTIKKHRKNIISLMIANHPESCVVCNQGNRCDLRRIAAEMGMGHIDLYRMPHYTGLEAANPFIIRDLSKCILCGKCIRADHELVAVGAIDYNLRGIKSLPATLHGKPLEQSSCTFCGTCVSMCPTGALMARNFQYVGSPQNESSTTCCYCGVGCSLVMGSVDGQIVEVNPSHREETVNCSTLCVRGHFAHDFLNVPERLSVPLIRKNGELIPVPWDEALHVVVEGLIAIKKKSGPQSIGFLGSSKCSNEENYLFQKMARVILGTNNVDNGGYLSGRSIWKRMDERINGGGRIKPLSCLDQAEVILVVGADPTQSLPVVGYFLKRATRMNGIPLIVADPRKTGLVPFSSLWLPLVPRSDSELINGLASILYKRKAHDVDFINRFTEGFDQYCEDLSSLDFEKSSQVTGLDLNIMEKAASLVEGKKITFVVGHGILQQKNGIRALDALINLALMTGSMGGDGKGFYFLARENNQLGAWDMGSVPDSLPGRQSIRNDLVRKQWEQSWGAKLSPDPGLNMVRMIEEAERGNLKALYIMGENPLRSLPQTERVRNAFKNMEFLVVQDILENETSRLADVVLPSAAFSEKGGSFTNMEGRIQSFDPVVTPPGDAKPDWEILTLLFTKMGHSGDDLSLEKVREEICHLVPMYAELGKRLKASWIKEKSNLRLLNPNEEGESAHFLPLGPSMVEEISDDSYPFKALLGSLRYQLGCGTRTGYSTRLMDFELKGEAEISPEDGVRLNVKNGDPIHISSQYGSISREVKINNGMRQGLIFIPTAFNGNDARHLIGLTQLGEKESPGWKLCNVKIEK